MKTREVVPAAYTNMRGGDLSGLERVDRNEVQRAVDSMKHEVVRGKGKGRWGTEPSEKGEEHRQTKE